MGYYTKYSLTWTSDNDSPEQDDAIGDAIENHGEFAYAINRDGDSNDSSKRYDHEVDIKAFSLKFPGVLFILSGEGEESGDIWKKYFLDGKMQICKAFLDFPNFDTRLLK